MISAHDFQIIINFVILFTAVFWQCYWQAKTHPLLSSTPPPLPQIGLQVFVLKGTDRYILKKKSPRENVSCSFTLFSPKLTLLHWTLCIPLLNGFRF